MAVRYTSTSHARVPMYYELLLNYTMLKYIPFTPPSPENVFSLRYEVLNAKCIVFMYLQSADIESEL